MESNLVNYNLDIPFKEFMAGQIIDPVQFNDDMAEIEEKVNEIVGKHNSLNNSAREHIINKDNPHEVTAHQVGTYTGEEIDGFVDDIKKGGLNPKSIKNEVLADNCVDSRTIANHTITASKVDSLFGGQIDISKNTEITDRYTKTEVDSLIKEKVGEGAYSKEEIDKKFQEVQAGQIVDNTIGVDKLKDDVGTLLDISANKSITDRYTKEEVDVLVRENGLPRDWGGLEEIVENQKYGYLPVANVMTADEFIAPSTPVLDIDVREVVGARGGYDNLGKRLNSIDSQLEHIENVNLQKKINIYEYSYLVNDDDWTNAFNTAFSENEGSEIFIPGGEYNLKDSLIYNGKNTVVGVKNKTVFNLVSDNKTLIKMLPSDQNNPFRANIYNINFKGLGKSYNQIGVDFKSWDSYLIDCTISDFNTGCKLKGTIIGLKNCYIHNNGKGIVLEQQSEEVPSTMITLSNCLLHYNTIGLYSTDEGNPVLLRPTIGLYIEKCAFEWNEYAFKLLSDNMHTKIKDCWFEQNSNRPQTYATNLILENNRYEPYGGKDQTIEFLSRDYQEKGYGGYTEIVPGYSKLKTIELMEFGNTNLLPNNTKKIEVENGLLTYDGQNVVTSSLSRHFSLIICKGDLKINTLPDGFIRFIKNAVGDYTLIFNGDKELRAPNIQVTFANDDGGTEVIGSTILQYKDQATYEQYYTVNQINLKCFKKEDNTPIDGRINISIWCDTIYN